MMKKAENYRKEHLALMKEWEQEGRKWLSSLKDKESRATFYADGVMDPEVWFDVSNTVRPLFVLKEVHEAVHPNSNEYCNFVGTEKDPGDHDIWDRVSPTWKRVGVLAKGILSVTKKDGNVPDYDAAYYMEENDYRNVLKRIAVINLKKFAAGKTVGDGYSKKTVTFYRHAEFAEEANRNYLYKQIKMISPNVIICCGAGVIEYIKPIADKLGISMVLKVDHPSYIRSRELFYNDTLEKIKAGIQE